MPIRLVVLTLAMLASTTSWAGVDIYEDGVKTLTCTRIAVPSPGNDPGQVPADPTFGTIIFGHQGNADAQPVSGQPLYDQALVAPGEVFLEVVTAGQSVHHMVWYDNGTLIRRENAKPYTARHILTAGRHQIAAVIYSSDTKIIGTYRVEIYVGDGGASADPAPSAPKLFSVTVEWSRPARRENGQPLLQSDIAMYHLTVNSSTYRVPGVSSSYLIKLPPGYYTATLIAEDTSGLRSDPSLPYQFQL